MARKVRPLTGAQRRRLADAARNVSRGTGFPESFAPVELAPGETLAYAAPRSVDGEIERQPALGGGGVLRDAVDGSGFHVRKRASARSVPTGELVTVRSTFAWEDQDKEVVSYAWRTSVISVPPGATPRERALMIYRAAIEGARNILEHNYEVGLSLTLDRIVVGEAGDDASESPARARNRGKPKRARHRGKAKRRGAKKAPRKAATKRAPVKAAKKAAKRPAAKVAPRKAAPKKGARIVKRAPVKKAAPKKATRAPVKKAAPKKATRATVKKAPAKKSTTKRAPARRHK